MFSGSSLLFAFRHHHRIVRTSATRPQSEPIAAHHCSNSSQTRNHPFIPSMLPLVVLRLSTLVGSSRSPIPGCKADLYLIREQLDCISNASTGLHALAQGALQKSRVQKYAVLLCLWSPRSVNICNYHHIPAAQPDMHRPL